LLKIHGTRLAHPVGVSRIAAVGSSQVVPAPGAIPIAIVMTSFEPGGTERQMIELIRRLDPNRWLVHLVCTKATGGWFDRAASAAATVTEFPVRSFRRADTARHLWNFSRWCRDTGVAVVHTTELPSNIFALPAAAMAGVPVRIGSRREINPDKTAAAIVTQRLAYTFAHRIVANSQAAANRLLFERVPHRKIAVVPNGLDIEPYGPRPPRRLLRNVLVVANLRSEKGHDVLIDAAGDVLRRYPDAHFELVGAGPERDALVARAHTRGVAHAFTFLGHRPDVAARLEAADIFVLPSRSEAFPNAVLEAMAARLPIVASGVGGILELLEEGRTGVLVPPGDPRALADRLCGLMGDPTGAAALGEAARSEAQGRYSFDRMVAAFERVYLTELTRRGIVGHGTPQLAAF
jgi:glycosyltransferase involved in cell wall biosynthesis